MNATLQEIRQMRKIQKYSAAVIVAAVMASGMTVFSPNVYASGTISATQKTALCAAIDRYEAQLAASTNPFVKKYLTALLAGLQAIENYVGGCPGS